MAKIERVRNIGVAAHIDAGKTTVTERFLFYSGKIHKIGEVHEGETQMDYMVQERARGITITAAATSFPWHGYDLHLIDTPGHVDFTIEVERSLRVLDGAVIVFSAVDGVEPQSETVWSQADKFHVPRLAFVNKMDRVGADFQAVVEQIEKRLGARPAAIQRPLGAEDKFEGAIDLVQMKAVRFSGDEADSPVVEEIDEDLRGEMVAAREKLVEGIADVDDQLAELYLAGEPVSADALRAAVRRATIANKVVPVLCGAALRNMGVQPLLDAVVDYLPSPIEVPPIAGVKPPPPGGEREPQTETRAPDDKAPFSGLAFKILQYEGRKTVFVRIYSGVLKPGDDVWNPRLRRAEKIARLFSVHANRRERIERAGAGMIVAVMGLKECATGDTICDAKHPILLERIDTYEPVISAAVEPESTQDKEKLDTALAKLTDEDPTFKVHEDPETGQTIVRGMGELHLDVIRDRLDVEYGVQARLGRPQVVYRETILRTAEAEARFERTLRGGADARGKAGGKVDLKGDEGDLVWGAARVRVQPRPRGSGVVLRAEVAPPPADLPDKIAKLIPQLVEAALEGLRESASSSASGYPMEDLEAVVIRVEPPPPQHAGPTLGYKIAAGEAFRKACVEAEVRLLEPIMQVEVVVPEEFMGSVVGDLNARRAQIEDLGFRGTKRTIAAKVPLKALFGYATAIRSASQGRATFTMHFAKYDAWS
jgi:elongation factor G